MDILRWYRSNTSTNCQCYLYFQRTLPSAIDSKKTVEEASGEETIPHRERLLYTGVRDGTPVGVVGMSQPFSVRFNVSAKAK